MMLSTLLLALPLLIATAIAVSLFIKFIKFITALLSRLAVISTVLAVALFAFIGFSTPSNESDLEEAVSIIGANILPSLIQGFINLLEFIV